MTATANLAEIMFKPRFGDQWWSGGYNNSELSSTAIPFHLLLILKQVHVFFCTVLKENKNIQFETKFTLVCYLASGRAFGSRLSPRFILTISIVFYSIHEYIKHCILYIEQPIILAPNPFAEKWIIPNKVINSWVNLIFLIILKEVSFARQGWIHVIKSILKNSNIVK